MLNSLYGKFAKNPLVRSKYPTLDEEGIIKYQLYPAEICKGLYIPTGTFITAYAREKTIRTSQKIRDYTLKKYGEDYYIYSDTDSIHMKKLSEEELKSFLEIDDYILGYWKLESKFKKGKWIRQKCYVEELQYTKEEYQKIIEKDSSKKDKFYYEDGYYYSLNVTVAGLPKKLGKYVSFENFESGFSILSSETDKEHKLTYKHVKGGVLLEDTDFTIK